MDRYRGQWRMKIEWMSMCVLFGALGCEAGLEEAPGTAGSSDASGTNYDAHYPSSDTYGGGDASPQPTPDPIDPTAGDRYEAPGTNPFVLAAADPLATFAADVDTASYDIFRRDISLYRQLPDPASVRLEELVNYFDYAYPAPEAEAEHPFQLSVEAAPSPFSETTLVRVGVQAKEIPPEAKRAANLVFLVDVSGSMDEPLKLPLVKVVLRAALDTLDPGDRVAIVTYAGSVAVRLESTPVSQRATIARAIDGLEAGGSTAGAAGIQLAYQQAEDHFIEGGINHVILCTDGDFNVGASSDQALVELITEKRRNGVTLTTLGFGSGNLNDSMMEKVADAGNGSYSMISSADQAIDYAHTRLLATMVMVAKDMKIQVVFNPARVLAYRLLGYENRAIADSDFRNDVVDAGEVGSGHEVTALFEVVPVGGTIPTSADAPATLETRADIAEGDMPTFAEDEVFIARVRYKDVDARASDPAYEVAFPLTADAIDGSLGEASADFKWAAAVAAFAEILKMSPFAHPEALPLIGELVHEATGADADRLEFAELFERAVELLGER